MSGLYVKELWRYPVKSMAGERLGEAEIGLDGVAGDRQVIALSRGTGRVVTARTRPQLLGHRGTLGPDGEVQVDGLPWHDERVADAVRAAAGDDVELVPWAGGERFDVLPLLVATDGAIEALGEDGRRLRPNIVIGGVDGLDERDWPGRLLRIGGAELELVQLRPRCVMTTFDPDTLAQDHGVLRRLVSDFGGTMALDTRVRRGGRIAVGEPVTPVATAPRRASPDRARAVRAGGS